MYPGAREACRPGTPAAQGHLSGASKGAAQHPAHPEPRRGLWWLASRGVDTDAACSGGENGKAWGQLARSSPAFPTARGGQGAAPRDSRPPAEGSRPALFPWAGAWAHRRAGEVMPSPPCGWGCGGRGKRWLSRQAPSSQGFCFPKTVEPASLGRTRGAPGRRGQVLPAGGPVTLGLKHVPPGSCGRGGVGAEGHPLAPMP